MTWHTIAHPGVCDDSAGGVYNPGAWGTDSLHLLCRREAAHPCTRGSQAPVYFSGSQVSFPTIIGHHTDARLEDFRPLQHAGITYVVHTVVRPGQSIRPALSILSEGTLTRHDDLALPIMVEPIEKNWVLLSHDGVLHLVYSLDPLRIFAWVSVECVHHWQRAVVQETGWTKALGKPPRNSANLLPWRGGYLGWWHQELDGIYVHGAYWLDETLHLRARTGILFDGQEVTEGHKPGVLYVSSQRIVGEVVLVYAGWADEASVVGTIEGGVLWGRMRWMRETR